MGNSIDKRQKWIQDDEDLHALNRALRVGVTAMRELAREFKHLNPIPGEVVSNVHSITGAVSYSLDSIEVDGHDLNLYHQRIDSSPLVNVWKQTIDDIARLPFRARIDLEGWDEVLSGVDGDPEKGTARVAGWVDDMDGEGRSIDEFQQLAFADALYEGIVFSFVDNDPRQFESKAARDAAGARPWVTRLKRGDFLTMFWEIRHARPWLTEVRFWQPQPRLDIANPHDWTDDVVPAIKRVLAGDPDAPKGSEKRKVRVEVYVQTGEGSTEYKHDPKQDATIEPDNAADELVAIPLVSKPSNRVGPWRGHSPFLDTAWLQAAIWRHDSELGGLASQVSTMRWFEAGTSLEPGDSGGKVLPAGHGTYRWSSNQAASLTLLESSGKPFESVQNLVDRRVEQIREAHHDISTRKPVQVTATESTLEGVHASSALEGWLILQERGWWQELELMALLGGLTKRGTVAIPHDFGLPSQGIERNQTLYLAGKMTAENFWPEKVRHGDVDEKRFNQKLEEARDKEEQVSAERARERLEKGMKDALTTPDNDDEPEPEKVEADA